MQTATIRRQRAYVPTGEVGQHLAAAQDIASQIAELEAQLSQHRAFLLEHMVSKGLHRIESGDFRVLLKNRHNWTYSSALEREMLQIRTSQKWEQSTGVAQDTPTTYIQFQTVKA